MLGGHEQLYIVYQLGNVKLYGYLVWCLKLFVLYLWYKNSHFLNWIQKFEAISINKIGITCNKFVKYQDITNYFFLFVDDVASGSGGSVFKMNLSSHQAWA
jgi:hypothetical protein